MPHNITPIRCPRCGLESNLASSMYTEMRSPRPGDTMVCCGCCCVMVFDDKLQPREPTAEEMMKIAVDPEVTAVSIAGGKIIQDRKRRDD